MLFRSGEAGELEGRHRACDFFQPGDSGVFVRALFDTGEIGRASCRERVFPVV